MPYTYYISQLNKQLEDVLEKVSNESILLYSAMDQVEKMLNQAILYKSVFIETKADNEYLEELEVIINKLKQGMDDIQDQISLKRSQSM
ncbi:MAG: hypothetical protein J6Q13_01485 [Clostridia bacterium]|nr:hypothetical protein [Clostridia bacterium]